MSVLLARGQYDGIATEADILDFYSRLPNPDRQHRHPSGSGAFAHSGPQTASFIGTSPISFMSMPKAQLV